MTKVEFDKLFDILNVYQNDWVLLRISDNFFINNGIRISSFYDNLKKRIGEKGLIVILSFSNKKNILRSNGVFDKNKTKSYCGLLSNYLISIEGYSRTNHPTNSVVAIGEEKKIIHLNHNFKSFSYDFMKPLINNNAKMINIDCDPISPGFTSVHYNEKILKLFKKSILNGMFRCNVKLNDGTVAKFKRRDFGLCSKSQNRFYKYYIANNKFKSGQILNSYFTTIKANDAFQIEKSILEEKPNFHTCKNLNCLSCNVYRLDRLYMIPIYYVNKLLNGFK